MRTNTLLTKLHLRRTQRETAQTQEARSVCEATLITTLVTLLPSINISVKVLVANVQTNCSFLISVVFVAMVTEDFSQVSERFFKTSPVQMDEESCWETGRCNDSAESCEHTKVIRTQKKKSNTTQAGKLQ